MREEGVQTEGMQRTREDSGAKVQTTLQNRLWAPVLLSGRPPQRRPPLCGKPVCMYTHIYVVCNVCGWLDV